MCCFPRKKKNIIKLKFTKRVIRTYISNILFTILYAILLTRINIFIQPLLIGLYLILYKVIFLIPFFLEYPIEKIIQYRFIKKARKKLEKYKPKIIAITGSYAKTSTKEYLYKVLSKYYKVIATPKSYNTILGITSFINDKLNEEFDYVILEVGVDSKNGMNKYLKLFTPEISIITGIAPQHLSTFKTLDNIINEKMKLAHKAKQKAFINEEFIKEKDDKFIYFNSDEIKASSNGFYYEEEYYQTRLFGEHLYTNLLAVIKVCKYLKVPDKIIKETIKDIENANHRFEPIMQGNDLIIDDSYNSNYYSFMKAIECVEKINKYKIIITPGLIELGKYSYRYNTLVAERCNSVFDKIILVGKNNAFIDTLKSTEKLETFSNFNDAYSFANKIKKDKVILIENDLPDVFIE
jgi:UDP-N-acetylmuramoyl-tripeptide--D-alanyl-D-alanine ligase